MEADLQELHWTGQSVAGRFSTQTVDLEGLRNKVHKETFLAEQSSSQVKHCPCPSSFRLVLPRGASEYTEVKHEPRSPSKETTRKLQEDARGATAARSVLPPPFNPESKPPTTRRTRNRRRGGGHHALGVPLAPGMRTLLRASPFPFARLAPKDTDTLHPKEAKQLCDFLAVNEPQNFELQIHKMQLFSPAQDWFSKFDLQKNHLKGLLNPDLYMF